jgi:PAS domain S-box-containing protein
MPVQPENPADEIRHLRRCISDLVSVLALPATWTGGTPSQILANSLDALVSILSLDFAYARLRDPTGIAFTEMVRVGANWGPKPQPEEFGQKLQSWLDADSQKLPGVATNFFGKAAMTLVPMQLGLQAEIGFIVAGSQRSDFPQQTEKLVLNIAVNQAAIGLQESSLLSESHEKLARSEERWRLVFENSAVGVALADFNARLLAANPVFQHMVGYTEKELKQLTFVDITVEEDRDSNGILVQGLIQGKLQQFQIEKRYLRKDGGVVWARVSVSMVPGTERSPGFLLALSEDVTERRSAEEALDETRSELAHMARVTTLSTLTAAIAHEINQPLSGIVTNASTCLRMLDGNPPNLEGARETARRTIRDGNRASEVTSRLRALFSKKNAAFELFDLNDAAKEVVALSMSELQRNRVVLRSEFALDLPTVLGDRTQIQQVILNLLKNGWDAMSFVEDRPRGLLIKTECDEGGGVRLSIKDSGVGIGPEIEKKLFEAFHTTKSDGMGIGLSVSRSIVERHQGRLWAIRNEGPGATFLFSIPSGTNT